MAGTTTTGGSCTKTLTGSTEPGSNSIIIIINQPGRSLPGLKLLIMRIYFSFFALLLFTFPVAGQDFDSMFADQTQEEVTDPSGLGWVTTDPDRTITITVNGSEFTYPLATHNKNTQCVMAIKGPKDPIYFHVDDINPDGTVNHQGELSNGTKVYRNHKGKYYIFLIGGNSGKPYSKYQ